MSRATIYKAEGGAGVAPKTGRALASALGVDPQELLHPERVHALPKVEASSPPEPRAGRRSSVLADVLTFAANVWEGVVADHKSDPRAAAAYAAAAGGLADMLSTYLGDDDSTAGRLADEGHDIAALQSKLEAVAEAYEAQKAEAVHADMKLAAVSRELEERFAAELSRVGETRPG